MFKTATEVAAATILLEQEKYFYHHETENRNAILKPIKANEGLTQGRLSGSLPEFKLDIYRLAK